MASLPNDASSILHWVSAHPWWLFGVASALLVPALFRRESRLASLGTVLAISALSVVVIGRRRAFDETPSPTLVVVSAEPLSSEVRRALVGDESRGDDGWDARFVSREGLPVQDLLALAELVGAEDRRVAFVWNGSSPAGPPVRDPAFGVAGFSEHRFLPFDPAAVSVRPVALPVVGRPVDLEVLWPDGAVDAGARIVWSGPGGVSETGSAEEIEVTGAMRLPFVPSEPGLQTLWIEWRRGPERARFEVAVEVLNPSRHVILVGDPGGRLGAALAAQGIPSRRLEDLSKLGLETAADAWLLCSRALSDYEQRKLVELIDRGAGVFLLEEGEGALPALGEPLAEWSPFTGKRLPEPSSDPASGEGSDLGPDSEDSGEDPNSGPEGIESELDASDPADMPADGTADAPVEGPATPDLEGSTDPFDPIFGDTSDADPTTVVEAEVQRRSVALILILDASGSMSDSAGPRSVSKLELAIESAVRTARELRAGDQLGIVAFGSQERVLLEFGPIPAEHVLVDGVRRLIARGPSNAVPAVGWAVEKLLASDLPVRHVVLLTDGAIVPWVATQSAGLADRLRRDGGGFSVVQVHPTKTAEVANIAARGGGSHLHTGDARSIPRLILSEVRRVLGVAARETPGDSDEVGPDDGGEPAPDTEPTSPEESTSDPAADEPPEPENPDLETTEPDGPESEDAPLDPDASTDTATERPEPAAELEVLDLVPSPILAPFVEEGFENLVRCAVVEARQDADTLLATFPGGRPLLAFANRGLGRIGGFAAPFSKLWWHDPRLPAMLATWMEAVAPAPPVDRRREAVVGISTLPLQPIGEERERLEQLFPGGLEPLESLSALEPRSPAAREATRSIAPEDAAWALLAFLALVLVERFFRRDR